MLGLELQLYSLVISSIKSITSVAVILFIRSVATANLDVLELMGGIIAEAAAEIFISCEDVVLTVTEADARAALMIDDMAGIGFWFDTDDIIDIIAVSVTEVADEVATNEAVVVAVSDEGVAAVSVANDVTTVDSNNEGELIALVGVVVADAVTVADIGVVLEAVIGVFTVVVVIGVTAVVLVQVISVFGANNEEILSVVDVINDEGFKDSDELVVVVITTDSVVVPLINCFLLADKCRRPLALSII